MQHRDHRPKFFVSLLLLHQIMLMIVDRRTVQISKQVAEASRVSTGMTHTMYHDQTSKYVMDSIWKFDLPPQNQATQSNCRMLDVYVTLHQTRGQRSTHIYHTLLSRGRFKPCLCRLLTLPGITVGWVWSSVAGLKRKSSLAFLLPPLVHRLLKKLISLHSWDSLLSLLYSSSPLFCNLFPVSIAPQPPSLVSRGEPTKPLLYMLPLWNGRFHWCNCRKTFHPNA